jgi:murein DD-endopeptidase MepM/ murein hydrolase activator NlpD
MPTIATLLACASPHGAPALMLPIDCVVGDDCWISSRPDTDPGPGLRDHAGSLHTYDGHDGTDVAVRHVGQATATWVRAPARGTVLRVRDDVPDGELLAAGPDAVAEHECGNGVVLDLGDEWQVQLCHLFSGTVVVSPGDQLEVGSRLGRVGWSGEADYPHVHLTLTHAGRKVDPFSGRFLDDGTEAAPGPLWSVPAPHEMDALAWAGFVPGPRAHDDDWPIDGPRGIVPATAPSLVLEIFEWRPEQGDVVRTEIRRPDGTVTKSEAVQPRDRPRQTWRIEKTWAEDERPVGLWSARVEWQRGVRKREVRAFAVLE